MAAWFNPRAVTYNANPYLVAQSGAIGDKLYELYKDARANKNELDKQAELKRQFDATFGENQRQFDINKALKEQEIANTKSYHDNSIKLQSDTLAETKRNNDLYNAYRNATLKTQNDYNNEMLNLKKQELANKNNDNINPFITQSLLSNNKALEAAGLTKEQVKQTYILYGNKGVSDLYNANMEIAKGNKDLGLDVGIKQKNIPVSMQNEFRKINTALNQGLDFYNFVNNNGGFDKFSGLFDRFKTGAPNLDPTDTGADYNNKASNFATSTSEILKGLGKYNYENLNDKLTPSVFGSNTAKSALINNLNMILDRNEELVQELEAQDYIGAKEARSNLEAYKKKINETFSPNKPQSTDELFGKNSIMQKR